MGESLEVVLVGHAPVDVGCHGRNGIRIDSGVMSVAGWLHSWWEAGGLRGSGVVVWWRSGCCQACSSYELNRAPAPSRALLSLSGSTLPMGSECDN